MDLDMLKARIAEGLVEEILVQTGYWVARGGRESQLQRLLRNGSDEMPDFLACKTHLTRPPLHRLFAVEVKYRHNVGAYLRQDGRDDCARLVTQKWSEAYLVIVTDNADAGRSCFQAIDVEEHRPDGVSNRVNLHEIPHLGIQEFTTRKYERLLKRMFVAIREEEQLRKSPVKVVSRAVETCQEETEPSRSRRHA